MLGEAEVDVADPAFPPGSRAARTLGVFGYEVLMLFSVVFFLVTFGEHSEPSVTISFVLHARRS